VRRRVDLMAQQMLQCGKDVKSDQQGQQLVERNYCWGTTMPKKKGGVSRSIIGVPNQGEKSNRWGG